MNAFYDMPYFVHLHLQLIFLSVNRHLNRIKRETKHIIYTLNSVWVFVFCFRLCSLLTSSYLIRYSAFDACDHSETCCLCWRTGEYTNSHVLLLILIKLTVQMHSPLLFVTSVEKHSLLYFSPIDLCLRSLCYSFILFIFFSLHLSVYIYVIKLLVVISLSKIKTRTKTPK